MMRVLRGAAVAFLLLVPALLSPADLSAQQSPRRELRGFEIERGWKHRTEGRITRMAGGPMASASILASQAVTGTLNVPVIPVQYFDHRFGTGQVAALETRMFGAPAGMMSAAEYYEEVSRGKFSVDGKTTSAVTLPEKSSFYVGNRTPGVEPAQNLGQFLQGIASRAADLTDWSQYDNDGPDGIPNSGDDDGYVDVVVLMYATIDGACTGSPGSTEAMWAHRWSLDAAIGQAYPTKSIGKNGQPIKLNDYIAVPGFDCNGSDLAPAGIMIHELGHVLGLPDLYTASTWGVGDWDLMGSGNWTTPEYPTSLGAWSRALLGWVDVVEVTDKVNLTIKPVHDEGVVYKVISEKAEDYLLLEYRTKTPGIDNALPGNGLVIWQVDPSRLTDAHLDANTVNEDSRMGVAVVQADGLNELTRTIGQADDRGDFGDMWPGAEGKTSFSLESQPMAVTLNRGEPLGLRLDRIRIEGGVVKLDVTQGNTRRARFLVETNLPGITAVLNDSIEVALPLDTLVAEGTTLTFAVDTADHGGTRIRFNAWEGEEATAIRTFTFPSRDSVHARVLVTREHHVEVAVADSLLGVVDVRAAATNVGGDAWVEDGTEVVITAKPDSSAERFLFWDADPDLHKDAAAIATVGASFSTVLKAPLRYTAVFAPVLPEGVTLDRATLESTEVVPDAYLRYLDAIGNRNGAYDIGDMVRALDQGLIRLDPDGIRIASPSAPKTTGGAR